MARAPSRHHPITRFFLKGLPLQGGGLGFFCCCCCCCFKNKLINPSIMRTFLTVDYHYSVQGDTDNCSRADDSLQSTKGSSTPLMREAVGPQERGSCPLPRLGVCNPACGGLPPQCPPLRPQPSCSPSRTGRSTATLPFAFTLPAPACSSPKSPRSSPSLVRTAQACAGNPMGAQERDPPGHSSHAALLFALFFNQVTRQGGCCSK